MFLFKPITKDIYGAWIICLAHTHTHARICGLSATFQVKWVFCSCV